MSYPILTLFRYVPYVACVALDGNPALNFDPARSSRKANREGKEVGWNKTKEEFGVRRADILCMTTDADTAAGRRTLAK